MKILSYDAKKKKALKRSINRMEKKCVINKNTLWALIS